MKDHILRTKLQRPPVAPDILPRARLLDRLNEGRQRPLTLISAPAGYGKSTLASRWVAACDCLTGWVSLDESDSDLRMFLDYVLAAIRSVFSKRRLQTEALLEGYQLPSVSVLAHHLLNDLHDIPEPFVLVLDDYHRIRGTDVHDLLTEFLTYPPRSVHLVLLTRRDPPLPMAKFRGRGLLTEIRAADLRFTPAEAAAFFNEKLKIPVDDDTAELLERKTEGWVAGLRLAGLYMRDKADPKLRVQELSGSSQHIAEYLIAEVLSRRDPEMLACLLETSILDRFCTPLCQAVHLKRIEGPEGDFDVQRFIEWLLAADLFVIPLDDTGYWFRYHHLFQDFLQSQLKKQSDAGTIKNLHLRASQWFAENGLIDEAIPHALAAGDAEAAARLVIAHRYDLMNNAEYCRISQLLKMLPSDAVANVPLLVTTRALLALQNGQLADIFAFTEQAQRLLAALPPKSAEHTTLKGETAALQSVVRALSGESAKALAAGREALESLPREAFFVRTLVIGAMAISRQMEGDLNQAVDLLKDALKLPGIPSGIQARIWFYSCIVSFVDGNSSGTLSAGRRALELADSFGLGHTRGGSRYIVGATHYLRNELAEAKSHLLGVLEDHAVSNATYVAQASGIIAFIALAEGCPERANEAVDLAFPDFWEMYDAYSPAIRDALRVELVLRMGMVSAAQRRSAGVDFDAMPPFWFLYVPQLTPIKLLLAQGTDQSLKEAHARLAELDERMRQINRKNVRIDVLALLALVCRKSGEEGAALKNLRAALELAEPGGFIRNFVDLGDPMRDLLERLHQVHPGDKYSRQVLEAFRAEAQKSLASGPSGPAPAPMLSQRETEILALLAEGLSNKEIAARLYIATETVKTHLKNIYAKLNAKGRLKALKAARTLGLIPSN